MHVFSFEDESRATTPYADCVVIFLGSNDPDYGTIDHAYSIWREQNVPPITTLVIGPLEALSSFHAERILSLIHI